MSKTKDKCSETVHNITLTSKITWDKVHILAAIFGGDTRKND